MRIMVCLKQVPDTTQVEIDETTGALKRAGVESKLNPYDLYALETAVRIKEEAGGEVWCITMGPPAAEEVLLESFLLGADRGWLLSDRRFAGADVLATSRTLARGIQKAGAFDLILCGRQTTDGDTAQVGPAIAEHLKIPHVSWVHEILSQDQNSITVSMDMMEFTAEVRMNYPCLLTVEKGICQPRLPSYRLSLEASSRPIVCLGFHDLEIPPEKCGLEGSPTQVERIFPPATNSETRLWELDMEQATLQLYQTLAEGKFVSNERGDGCASH